MDPDTLNPDDVLAMWENMENMVIQEMLCESSIPDGYYVSDDEEYMVTTDFIEESCDKCPECGVNNSVYVDTANGIKVCRACEAVLEEGLTDDSPEWRQHGNEDGNGDNTSRCGGPLNFYFPNSSLGTTISNNPLLKKYNNWNAMPYRERSLYMVFLLIQNSCNKADIKKCVIDDAKDYYNKVNNCKYTSGKPIILRGINRKSLIAACVYFACCKRNTPMSYKKIADIFKINTDEMTTGCRIFLDLMEQCDGLRDLNTNLPAEYIRLQKDLPLKRLQIDLAAKIAENVRKLNLATEHMPPSTAAACILMACKIAPPSVTLNKRQVAEAFDISEVTITKTYKKIKPFRKVLYSDKYTEEALKLITYEREQMLEFYKKGPLVTS
jgi:transcription initiation factor TFIIIB Brf1 subunit/transcription initiation factor TFIIB